jgi:hypothetical protein
MYIKLDGVTILLIISMCKVASYDESKLQSVSNRAHTMKRAPLPHLSLASPGQNQWLGDDAWTRKEEDRSIEKHFHEAGAP